MRKYFFLLLFFYAASTNTSWAQVKTVLVPERRQVRVDDLLYNKQTGEKMSGEQLFQLLQDKPGIQLETIYNRYGEPEKIYYDPQNPFYKKALDPKLRPQVGEQFPLFSFRDIENQLHHAEDLRGSWVVIYFYPILESIREKDWAVLAEDIQALKEKNVKIKGFGVFATSNDPKPVVGQYQENIRLVNNGHGFFETYQLIEFPATFLIDPSGKIVSYWNRSEQINLLETIQEKK